MARPKNTYVSTVFNFGIDKNIPFGFVDVVFDKTGNAVGFEKDGKFYNLGDKLPKPTTQPLTSDQLSKKVDLLQRKLDLNKTRASNQNISSSERNKYIQEFKKTEQELSKTKRLQVETEIQEGKLSESQAKTKAAEALRFELRSLNDRKTFLKELGQSTTDVDNLIIQKEKQLTTVINPTPIKYKSANTVPDTGRPFAGKSVTGAPIAPVTPTATAPVGPTGTGGGTGGAAGGAGGKGGKGGEVVATTATGPEKTPEQRYADAIAKAQELYQMPDIIFRNIPSLGALLKKYVDGKLTDQQFVLELQNDPWYRSNSAEIKARYVQLFNYEDLVKSGRATGTTDYEQQLARIIRNIQAKARELNGIEIPDDQAKLLAKDLYIYNLDNDPAVLTERLVRFIRPTAGMIGGIPTLGYSGQALQNYQTLQAIAKSNGLRIEDILPRDATGAPMTAEGILEQLALGKLDLNRIAQDSRKLAALGQPDFVKDLLGQGYDLETIYFPYRNAMAASLELDPNTISLSDPALRMGISKEGDMNLYDHERSLRQDGRWQYTKQAREEVSDVALRVLRDFGFTG